MAGLDGDATSSTIYIDDLIATNPESGDAKSQGDDHLRFIKKVLKNTFPNITGPVTSTAAELNALDGIIASVTELNYVDGVTSAIQTQLNTKAPTNSPTFTGTVVLPSTTSIGNVSDTELATLNGITASTVELNYNDITTLGTMEASKALTADANNTLTVPSGGEINFASGSQLQIGGVAVTASATQLNGPVLVTPVATTSGVAVEIATAIPTYATKVTVTLNGVSTNGTSNPKFQLGTSGGYVTSGYNGAVGTTTSAAACDAINTTTGIRINWATVAGGTIYGAVEFIKHDTTTNCWSWHGTVYYNNGAGGTYTNFLAGSVVLTDAFAKIKIMTENGIDAFDAGQVSVVYD